MSIFEYNEEEHLRMEREEAWTDGKAIGIEIGIAQGEKQMLQQLIQTKRKKGKSLSQIAGELERSEEEIRTIMDKE